MEQLFVLKDYKNSENMSMPEVISEYKRLETMKREVETRLKLLKEDLLKELETLEGNQYRDNKFEVTSKPVVTKRLDSNWVKDFVKNQNVEPKYIESESRRLNIRYLGL